MNNNTPSVVTISSGTIFKAILIGLLFWFLYFFHELLLVVLTAVVIASAIEPLTRWCVRYRLPRVITVIALYVVFALLLSAAFYFFLPPLISETTSFIQTLPEILASFDVGEIFGYEISGQDFSEAASVKELLDSLRDISSGVTGGFFSSISTLFGNLLNLILIIVLSFYLSVQERGIEQFLRLVTPVKHEQYVIHLWERSQRKIGLWMQGQLLLGALVGILVYLGLTILGVKYAFFLAILAALFELIPLFGPILAAIPAVIIGFLDSATLGFMVIGLYIIIQQFENHLIYPLVVRKVVGVSPIIVILALVIGGKIAGFLGLLLAVPVSAALMELTNDIQREKHMVAEREKHHTT